MNMQITGVLIIAIGCFFLGGLMGFLAGLWQLSFDKNFVRLEDGQVVIDKSTLDGLYERYQQLVGRMNETEEPRPRTEVHAGKVSSQTSVGESVL
jgi:hypothetical protein